MKLDASDSPAQKRRWQIVRLDFCGPNNGVVASGEAIVEADEETGHVVTLQQTGKPTLEPVTTEYGRGAIRLVRRR